MLLELWCGGMLLTGIMALTEDHRHEGKIKKEIENKWNYLMLSHQNSAQNKINQHYELVKIIIKEYGFNAIVTMPVGTSMSDIRKLLPSIEMAYGGDAILEMSNDKTSAYLRVAINGLSISDKDKIKFKWYKTFFKGEKCRNNYGETYKIEKVEDIVNPNKDKDDEDRIVGHKLIVSIPEGLNYDNLSSFEEAIGNTIGRCFMKWNKKIRRAEVEIITNPLKNSERFVPIACDPWELYISMRYSYKPIMLDYKRFPNGIVGGMTGSGKTVSLIMAFLNLCYFHNRDKIRLVIGLISDKQDFRIFKDINQCDYYARNLKDSLKAIKYLTKEASRRNKLFESCRKLTTNIYEYNKLNKKNQLPLVYFMTDEIANYMELSSDFEAIKKDKNEFMDLFWKLAREGRSAGIYITVATQRGDTKNLDSNIKANLTNKISYKQSNTASALTIFGNGDNVAKRVTSLDMSERESLIEYFEGITIGKTLYLDTDMMEELLKDKIVQNKKHLILDDNGNILKEEPKTEKTIEESKFENIKPIDKQTKKTNKKPRYIKNKEKKNEDVIDINTMKENYIKKKREYEATYNEYIKAKATMMKRKIKG